jgi:hypothetical protein
VPPLEPLVEFGDQLDLGSCGYCGIVLFLDKCDVGVQMLGQRANPHARDVVEKNRRFFHPQLIRIVFGWRQTMPNHFR